MSDAKLTPAQKRAIREARKNEGVLVYESCPLKVLQELQAMGLTENVCELSRAGWAVEVGDGA